MGKVEIADYALAVGHVPLVEIPTDALHVILNLLTILLGVEYKHLTIKHRNIMITNKYLLLIISFLLLSSCKQKNNITNKKKFDLIETSDEISFDLDDNTTLLIKALFLYTENNNKEYLTFQNDKEPEILFYDIKTQAFIKKISLETEGNNGVGKTLGYYIKNMNEIYLTSLYFPHIIKINGKGEIIKKIDLKKSTNQPITEFQSMSFCYRPLFFIGNNLYIPQFINKEIKEKNNFIENSPLSITLDTTNMHIEHSDFKFPPILSTKEYYTQALGVEYNYSRCFDGEKIIYSFGYDENIYITSIENKLTTKKPIKSKYIKKLPALKNRPENIQEGIKKMNEIPLYGNLIYDKYQNIYYRICYPETEIDKKENMADIWQFGRKIFSIIILDKDLNIIGEKLFPEYTYISTLTFIREDGLYICNSHYKNPNFKENKLSFKRFTLQKKNNS